MNKRMRNGKISELIVAGELLKHEIDCYIPAVDDQGIDLIIRTQNEVTIKYFDVQIKSIKGYNRIVGLSNIDKQSDNFILIIHYKHEKKEDEFFYLTKDQIKKHYLRDSDWKDLVFNKPEREKYKDQDLSGLSNYVNLD